MSYENILFEEEDAIATISINRPKSLNALNPPTLREIAECLGLLRTKPEVKCLVFTGVGDRAFVAGADISEMASMTPIEGKAFAALGLSVARTLEELHIPVIAAVNGYALGGGIEIALACDMIIASEKARFGQPEINLGVIPGFGGTQRLARRIGLPLARELIYTGEMIDAEKAERLGLVNRVVTHDDCLKEAKALAATLTTKPAIAIQQAKSAINAGIDMDIVNACRFEMESFALTFATEDKSEGMSAFLEKRPPNFRGR